MHNVLDWLKVGGLPDHAELVLETLWTDGLAGCELFLDSESVLVACQALPPGV